MRFISLLIKSGIILICSLLILTGCISRMSQPELKGSVVSDNSKPLVNVTVTNHWESVNTDEQGWFVLAERRYHAFLLKELFYMEAPPLFISVDFAKKGYQTCTYRYRDSRGGSSTKGTSWDLGKVVLPLALDSQMMNMPKDKCIFQKLPSLP